MGKNLDTFRANHDWQTFLVNALYLALEKPRLTPEQKSEWESDVKDLKGRTDQEYEEIAAATDWALKVHPEWPKYIRRMKNVVDNVDRILRDYRAEMRAKRNQDRAANGEEYSPSCLALMAKYPNWTRSQIRDEEVAIRARREIQPIIKACTLCHGTYHVLSTHKNPNLNGKKVECPACRDAYAKIFAKHIKELQQELWGQSTPAYA